MTANRKRIFINMIVCAAVAVIMLALFQLLFPQPFGDFLAGEAIPILAVSAVALIISGTMYYRSRDK